jgi:hypothetical protein
VAGSWAYLSGRSGAHGRPRTAPEDLSGRSRAFPESLVQIRGSRASPAPRRSISRADQGLSRNLSGRSGAQNLEKRPFDPVICTRELGMARYLHERSARSAWYPGTPRDLHYGTRQAKKTVPQAADSDGSTRSGALSTLIPAQWRSKRRPESASPQRLPHNDDVQFKLRTTDRDRLAWQPSPPEHPGQAASHARAARPAHRRDCGPQQNRSWRRRVH